MLWQAERIGGKDLKQLCTMTLNHLKPSIRQLDLKGSVFALQDEYGSTIGTGSPEVCELLLYMISKRTSEFAPNNLLATGVDAKPLPNVNIRSAIII
jgi:hypothetical protein